MVAKWTTDASEVEMISSLQRIAHPRFRNRVIWAIDTVPHGSLGTFIVMPKHTPLQSLSRLTPEEYYTLRRQIIEVRVILSLQMITDSSRLLV